MIAASRRDAMVGRGTRRAPPAGVAVRGGADPDARHRHRVSAHRCAAGQSVRVGLSGDHRNYRNPAGLLPNQDVTLRGVPIGRGGATRHHPGGRQRGRQREIVGAHPGVERCAGVGAVAGGRAVHRLRRAVPMTDPYLRDGSIIEQGRATVPVSLARSAGRCRRRAGPGGHGQARAHQARIEPEQGRARRSSPTSSTAAPSCCPPSTRCCPETTSVLRTSRSRCSPSSPTRTPESTSPQTISARASTGSTRCGMAIADSPNRRQAL